MNLHPTKEMCRLAYKLVAETPPFNRWNLPSDGDIKFTLNKSRDTKGFYKRWKIRGHRGPARIVNEIGISVNCVGSLSSLCEVMGHEMIHLHEEQCGTASPHTMHNKAFIAWSKLACKWHGWDFKLFV